LVIRRKEKHRSIQENAEPKQELFAAGGKMFFSEMADEFLFETDANGHGAQTVPSISGKIPIKRIDLFPL
jgi:hypothetical protein